jgi:tRNA threonylcarbamoyladenosine biosynthesis protein TsaE
VIRTHSEAETAAVARSLARTLPSGSVVLLSGNLGAGKTAFVRGLAEGLGINPEDVSSPTFTLIQEYRGGRLPLHHVDLYRLSPLEVDDLGLDELTLEPGITAIEWPDRLPRPFKAAVRVSIGYEGSDIRSIAIDGAPEAIPGPAGTLSTTQSGSSAPPE